MTDVADGPSPERHWDDVYRDRDLRTLSWFQPHDRLSLDWIGELGLAADAPIVDVGAGASPLAADLLASGHRDVTVLDWSATALDAGSAARRGGHGRVHMVHDDVLGHWPRRRYMLWHDRAAFHFLTEPSARERYRERLRQALEPDGYVLVGTFAPGGPARCSGLPVARYRPDALLAELGPGFRGHRFAAETHVTPAGHEQAFTWVLARREAADA